MRFYIPYISSLFSSSNKPASEVDIEACQHILNDPNEIHPLTQVNAELSKTTEGLLLNYYYLGKAHVISAKTESDLDAQLKKNDYISLWEIKQGVSTVYKFNNKDNEIVNCSTQANVDRHIVNDISSFDGFAIHNKTQAKVHTTYLAKNKNWFGFVNGAIRFEEANAGEFLKAVGHSKITPLQAGLLLAAAGGAAYGGYRLLTSDVASNLQSANTSLPVGADAPAMCTNTGPELVGTYDTGLLELLNKELI